MYQVMIVDDEPTSVNLLKTVIEKKCDGFQVTEIAYDGTEAMEKLKGVQPDILITDIQMQVMSGLELVKRIREKYPEMLCVLVSGYQEFEYAKQAIQYRVSDYILKPIVPSDIKTVCETGKETETDVLLSEKYPDSQNGKSASGG